MCSIEKLVMRIQNGEDEEAFVQLENKVKPLMHMVYYRHFYYCVELEDFIQEASFLLFYTAKKFDFKKGKSFLAYYRKSLKNYAIQLVRREHRESVVPEKYICKYDISNIKYNLSVEEEFLLKEEMPRYWNSLSAFEKAVFYFYTSGYSFEEIAEKSKKYLEKYINFNFERRKNSNEIEFKEIAIKNLNSFMNLFIKIKLIKKDK